MHHLIHWKSIKCVKIRLSGRRFILIYSGLLDLFSHLKPSINLINRLRIHFQYFSFLKNLMRTKEIFRNKNRKNLSISSYWMLGAENVLNASMNGCCRRRCANRTPNQMISCRCAYLRLGLGAVDKMSRRQTPQLHSSASFSSPATDFGCPLFAISNLSRILQHINGYVILFERILLRRVCLFARNFTLQVKMWLKCVQTGVSSLTNVTQML